MNKSLTATLRYAQTSEKKMEVMAKMIRGKKAEDALNVLRFVPNKWAKILSKVLKSAVSNATHNWWEQKDNLYVSKVDIWKWMKIKRMKFVGRSRTHWYIKHRSFVRVVLDNK